MARRRLPTWSGQSEFECDGAIGQDITIYYGKGFRNRATISADQVCKMLSAFKGKDVSIGTSRTTARDGSLGMWLQKNVTRTAIASYVGPLLITDGVARRGTDSDRIKFA